LESTIKRIIQTGSVADIWETSPFTIFLEQINDVDLKKLEHLDLQNNHKLCSESELMKLD
jgi:hypothetical protein